MKYIEIKFNVRDEDVEKIENYFYENEIYNFSQKSLRLLQEIKENPWAYNLVDEEVLKLKKDTTEFKVFFDLDEDASAQKVMEELKALKAENISKEILDDTDWKDNWKKFFHKLNFGKLKVVPTWEKEDPDRFTIVMDPGMAFGSGTHETTQLSIEMLERYVKPDDSVLDVGTGSGILAMAAKKLGAGKVLGIDIDEDAVRVARRNAEDNNEVIEFVEGNLVEKVDDLYDVVVANIIAEIVVEVVKDLDKVLKPGGIFLCSGILKEREELVKDALIAKGLEIIHINRMGEWIGIGAKYV